MVSFHSSLASNPLQSGEVLDSNRGFLSKFFPLSVILVGQRVSRLELTLESGYLGLSLRGKSYSGSVVDFRDTVFVLGEL